MLRSVLTTFPELAEAVKRPLRDAKSEQSLARVLDILLNARAPRGEIRALASKWSQFANESSTGLSSAMELLPRIRESDPEWHAAKLANARLLLHVNKPRPARALLQPLLGCSFDGDDVKVEVEQLYWLSFLREDDAAAARAKGGKLSLVNNAALEQFINPQQSDSAAAAAAAWQKAVDALPQSLAALNGAGKFEEALKVSNEAEAAAGEDFVPSSETEARVAQALIGLASQAKDGKFAVTSEGLYRGAISKLEQCVQHSKKPVYSLELARAYTGYAKLLHDWDKREEDALGNDAKAARVLKSVAAAGNSFLPSFAFELRGWDIVPEENKE